VAKYRDMFFTSKVGTVVANSGLYWLWNNITVGFAQANPGVNAMEAVKILPPISKDSSSAPVWPRATNVGGTAFSSKCSDAKLERIVRFFDWSLSPEGATSQSMASRTRTTSSRTEGGLDPPEQGNRVQQAEADLGSLSSINLFNLVRWDAQAPTELLNPIYPKAIIDLEKQTTAMLSQNLAPVNILIESLSTPRGTSSTSVSTPSRPSSAGSSPARTRRKRTPCTGRSSSR